MLLYVYWNVHPEIFPGVLPIRWYGLLFAAAFFFGYMIAGRMFRYEKLPESLLDKMTIYVFIATIIGARLGHVLFYEPDYFLKNPLSILKIWEGGLASHGAAVTLLIAVWLFCRKYQLSYLWALDRLVIVVALGGFFIRMGNLMNSEIYGHVTNVPWAFVFVREDNLPRHPTQIYEGLSYLSIFLFLLWYYYRHKGKPVEGMIFGMFLSLLFTVRFLIEFVKEPQVEFEKSMLLNMGQLLSLPFMLAGLVIIFLVLRRERRI